MSIGEWALLWCLVGFVVSILFGFLCAVFNPERAEVSREAAVSSPDAPTSRSSARSDGESS